MKPLDMPDLAWKTARMANDMVTREEAQAVLALVEKKFSSYLKTWPVVDGKLDFDAELIDVPEYERPKLVENYDGKDWAIVWEGGPFEWAYADLADAYVDEEAAVTLRDEFQAKNATRLASTDGVQGMPKGVVAEPFFSFVLVLYKEV